ncbi:MULTISPECIES: tyrosine-type recombinase/integrase [unclassified Mycobacterium]|uniref:tyrosine-type recombinase/integrase n=1 Tax=unclassified Mycobacterium TaxID=2642494 RepID=UPI0029C8F095|nr:MULTISPECIES: tyrosine-type recombinase/integrase [unclassified Mycobacterium]
MTDGLLDLDALQDSWLITLRGERKSPATLKAYRAGVTSYLSFCRDQTLPLDLTKDGVRAFMASLAEAEPATARLRLTALKLFARWLAAEEGFDADPVLAVRAPKLDDKAVPDLSDDEVRRIVKACKGPTFRDKRDLALVVLLTETGLRAAECLALDVADLGLTTCTLLVRRGKGGKGRTARFSAAAAADLDRYIRARRAVGAPDVGALWVGSAGARRLSYRGMTTALKQRADQAGVPGFHVHRLRHTAAVRWLSAGGTEGGLMAQSGWASRKMIDRYVKTAAEDLASAEFDRLNLGVRDL